MAKRSDEETGTYEGSSNERFNAEVVSRFAHIAALAERLFDVPVAIVTLEGAAAATAADAVASIKFAAANFLVSASGAADEIVVVEDTRTDARFANTPFVTGAPHIISFAFAPLTLEDGTRVGTLFIADQTPRSYDAIERDTLAQLGSCVVRELELAREANYDELTGLLRRGIFFRRVRQTLADTRASGGAASLAVMDLDRFKSINDQYGHAAGDLVLKEIARILRAALGRSVELGRLGGEEIGILMPNMSPGAALICLEHTRTAIATHKFAPLKARKVTASFGLMPYMPPIDDETTWYKLADIALYSAKQSGRNKVTCYDHMMVMPTDSVDLQHHDDLHRSEDFIMRIAKAANS